MRKHTKSKISLLVYIAAAALILFGLVSLIFFEMPIVSIGMVVLGIVALLFSNYSSN